MKAISTGNNGFKKIIEKDYYYVDKTQIIEDLFKNLYIKESKYYELRGSIPIINIVRK